MKSDHDAKISFWPASGSVASCQLSRRVDRAVEGWVPSGSASAASRSEDSGSVCLSFRHVGEIALHTEQLKDSVAQDGSHGMDCGGGAGQLPLKIVIAYAYTKVLVTRHDSFALGCRRLCETNSAGWTVLCLWQELMRHSLSAWSLHSGQVEARPNGRRLAACDLRERRVRSPHKRRLLRPAADPVPITRTVTLTSMAMNPESSDTSRLAQKDVVTVGQAHAC